MKPGDVEAELANEVARYEHDCLGFTQFAYPWGVRGGPLAQFSGPQHWQAERQLAFSSALKSERGKGQFATASGKGIGKSALIAHTAWWGLSTFEDTRIRITAGTEPQLRTTTMPELAKWYHMLICKHWFHLTATAAYSVDPAHDRTWRLDAVPWNASNPEAFAGVHNLGKRIVFLMDEASQIADAIFDTTDGIMTDVNTQILWAVFGNPTRNSGRFFRCFNDMSHRWASKQIDSRTVPISDKNEIQSWLEDYGEDSDYFRMMVRGMFPRASSMQFISTDLVRAAMKREAWCHLSDALILGVDVARFGDDQSVIAARKGNDARTIPWIKLRNVDTMQLAATVAERATRYKADAIHVDAGAMGSGVVDRLRQLGFSVRGVQFGAAADRSQVDLDATAYANKRSEMYGYMREWLVAGSIPDDTELERDLTGVLFGVREGAKRTELILEKKEHMQKRMLASPDTADALALTFAYPVLGRLLAGGPQAVGRQLYQARTEYDPLADMSERVY